MPIPALTIQQSAAIAIPICLVGYAAQEIYVRRRTVKREAVGAEDTGDTGALALPTEARVTAVDAPKVPRATERSAARAGAPAASTKPTARAPRSAATEPATPKPATPRPVAAKPRPVAPKPAPAKPVAARPKPAKPGSPKPGSPRPKAAGRAPARKPIVTLEGLEMRRAALRQGLDAIIAFVDSAPRRAAATACADALLLSVPREQRGPGVAAYLHAAGAKEKPSALQDLAEEAGVEIATAIRAIGAEIKARQ